MNRLDAEHQRALWLNRPLCRRYAVGFFSDAVAQVRCSAGTQEQTIQWALGFLGDGDCELLGAWIKAGMGLAATSEVFADLEIRGVEAIRFVVGGDSAGIGTRFRATSLGATQLPSIEQTLSVSLAQVAPRHRGDLDCALRAMVGVGGGASEEFSMTAFERGPWGERYPQIVATWHLALAQWAPVFALPASLRRVVFAGDRNAAELHGSLVRAIARHGCFADQAAALDFVADALLRAERRLGRFEQDLAAAGPSRRRVGASAHLASLSF